MNEWKYIMNERMKVQYYNLNIAFGIKECIKSLCKKKISKFVDLNTIHAEYK